MEPRDADKKDEDQVQPARKQELIPSSTPTSTTMDSEEKEFHDQGKHVTHDSMVTVRLSEPPQSLHINTNLPPSSSMMAHARTDSKAISEPGEGDQTPSAEIPIEESPRITMLPVKRQSTTSLAEATSPSSRRGSGGSENSEGEEQVDWEELEKTEGQEPKDQWTDDFTALSLARLEEQNNLLAANPKSGINRLQNEDRREKRQSRPPSIRELKELVKSPSTPALRYTLVPPPPMTDLQFYAAVVQDYSRVAQYLPTLLSKKIRSGVPDPLRGQVWQSMSGARDLALEEQFDQLCGESSPYEGIIGKDLGRSFPGVEMFRDPEGTGQKRLGRVLKCFSLYDQKIGYCQGLGFIVGPLLMKMDDKQAFCILVRLMENYDLRNCFLPDLSGLHVRIYQFRELLKQHLPTLSAHLQALQVEPQYVSQWFLSFFAVTCPLRMLFRIYDVIFAEGASETIMRVALSLMQKNEQRILACTEFEDVMQLLLSRGLWDCYNYNEDEFVDNFVSLSTVVTRDSLTALETSFKDSSRLETVTPADNVGSAASRFLGRLWAGNAARNLSPGLAAPSRPVSFLRRSPSKQSIASTLNSMEGTGSDSIISASTDATSVSRDSSNSDDSSSLTQSVSFANATMVTVPRSNKDKDLHDQIEDLLMALSEMQRNHAVLANQLQREREEREEDRTAVRSLLDGLRKKSSSETVNSASSNATARPGSSSEDSDEASPLPSPMSEEELSQLLDVVEDRFTPKNNRRSSMMQTKTQLRDEVARAKEQLVNETSRSQSLSRQIMDQTQEMQKLRDQVKESQLHVRNAHAEKQRLEKQVRELKSRKGSSDSIDNGREPKSEWPARSSGPGGLRELRLGRPDSARSQTTATFNKRTSSLNVSVSMKDSEIPLPPPSPTRDAIDADALVLELVQAKTAEAVAKQEAEEAKAKLEHLRKMLGMGTGTGDSAGSGGHRASPSLPQSMVSGFTGVLGKPTPRVDVVPPPTSTPAASAGVGGFWGWGKRNVSSADTSRN